MKIAFDLRLFNDKENIYAYADNLLKLFNCVVFIFYREDFPSNNIKVFEKYKSRFPSSLCSYKKEEDLQKLVDDNRPEILYNLAYGFVRTLPTNVINFVHAVNLVKEYGDIYVSSVENNKGIDVIPFIKDDTEANTIYEKIYSLMKNAISDNSSENNNKIIDKQGFFLKEGDNLDNLNFINEVFNCLCDKKSSITMDVGSKNGVSTVLLSTNSLFSYLFCNSETSKKLVDKNINRYLLQDKYKFLDESEEIPPCLDLIYVNDLELFNKYKLFFLQRKPYVVCKTKTFSKSFQNYIKLKYEELDILIPEEKFGSLWVKFYVMGNIIDFSKCKLVDFILFKDEPSELLMKRLEHFYDSIDYFVIYTNKPLPAEVSRYQDKILTIGSHIEKDMKKRLSPYDIIVRYDLVGNTTPSISDLSRWLAYNKNFTEISTPFGQDCFISRFNRIGFS